MVPAGPALGDTGPTTDGVPNKGFGKTEPTLNWAAIPAGGAAAQRRGLSLHGATLGVGVEVDAGLLVAVDVGSRAGLPGVADIGEGTATRDKVGVRNGAGVAVGVSTRAGLSGAAVCDGAGASWCAVAIVAAVAAVASACARTASGVSDAETGATGCEQVAKHRLRRSRPEPGSRATSKDGKPLASFDSASLAHARQSFELARWETGQSGKRHRPATGKTVGFRDTGPPIGSALPA